MKKFLTGLVMAATIMSVSAVASAKVEVLVDGEKLELSSEAIIENDSTLVPMRELFEALDARVDWDNDAKKAVAYSGINVLTIGIDSDIMLSSGEEVKLPAPARLVNEKTYVPLRAISESFGAEVMWDGETRTVLINTVKLENDIKTNYIDKDIKNDSEETVMRISVAYPEIRKNADSEGIKDINKYNKTVAEYTMELLEASYKDVAIEVYNTSVTQGKVTQPVFLYKGYVVIQDKFDILSVNEGLYIGFGEEYELNNYTFYNKNLKTGGEVPITDILNITEKDLEILSYYDYFLSEKNVVFCLKAEYSEYANKGYEETLVLEYNDTTKELFKIDITTWTALKYGEPTPLFE